MRKQFENTYSDSSSESSYSCDISHENKATVRQRRARKRQQKDEESNETAKAEEDSSRKEDYQSVSDDSLEVIVVKKSLEKKCEKIVSERKSKTPRECTKETRIMKTHKRSSKCTSRADKSKISGNNEDAMHRTPQSPDKKEKTVDESSAKFDGDTEKYRGEDVTDSTSQETVKRVVVTAMVHKDQMPDTPKSIFETTRETSLDDVLRKESAETVDGTLSNVGSTNENETMSCRIDVVDSDDGFQQSTQHEIDQDIQNDKAKPAMPADVKNVQQEKTDDETRGKS